MKVNVQYISERDKKLQVRFFNSEFSKTVELTDAEIEEMKINFDDTEFAKRILLSRIHNN